MKAVTIRLMGGLGNQMFQYATGYALARKWNVPLLLDRSFLDARPPGMDWTPRPYALDVFRLHAQFATPRVLRRMRREWDRPVWRGLSRALPSLFRPQCYLERSTGHDAKLATLEPPIYLEGFWQNEGYFNAVARELRDEVFVPVEEPPERNASLLREIASVCSASIHVRRGDYVHNAQAAGYHGTCTVEYYRDASEELVRDKQVDHFFVFSDDPAWAKANLQLPRPATHVAHNTGAHGHWDLWLMKHCRHHIIANSSFSWWGAWLNAQPGKCVIAPARWFQGTDMPPSHILPASWTAR